jgi:predicted metalloprotease with PDZ domain
MKLLVSIWIGIDYHLRRASNRKDKGGKPAGKEPGPWMGATLVEQAGRSVFKALANGGPAEKAGIAPGDVAVALDGLALTASNCDRRLRTYRDKDRLELVVFRGDELITTKLRLEDAPESTCYLQLDKEADAAVLGRQAAWLQTG